VLCALFSYAACLLALGRPGPLGVSRAVGVLGLLGLGMLSKEPAVAMVGVLMLADIWFTERPDWLAPVRRWKLYAPLLVGGLMVGRMIYRVAGREGSAGGTAGIGPIDYLLTQVKVIWLYLRLVLFPAGQNIDHGFPATHVPGDVLAWLGLAGLAGLIVAAWVLRRRYPVASLGLLAFLVLLAPTSSILPIADTMVERRIYLGSLGLVAIAADFLARLEHARARRAIVAATVLVLGFATWRHNGLYASSEAMWESAVEANPNNARAQFQLADAYFRANRCADSLAHFDAVGRLQKPDYRLLVNWAQALDCAGDSENAVKKLRDAVKLERNPAAWDVLGMVLAKRGDTAGAIEALNTALAIHPYDAVARFYRGNVYLMTHDARRALADYEAALAADPSNEAARHGRDSARQALGEAR
jgi:tetratricopeptide (TPR) repeat protein